MPTNPFHAIAPLTRADNSVYMLMATHILIHWAFPDPTRENLSPSHARSKPEPFNLITEICIGGIEASRRDVPEIIRLHTFSTMQQFASDIVPSACVSVYAREKPENSLSLLQQRSRRTAWFGELNAGKLVPRGSLIALFGAIIKHSYHSASEDVHQDGSCRTTIKGSLVLRWLSPTSRIMLRGMGGERENVEERKTPKHKQQN